MKFELSNYVTIVVNVPETHADKIREVIGRAGGGKIGNYSFCSFSVKGLGRFMPSQEARPFIGTAHQLETVKEERIEVVCSKDCLEKVVEAIKKDHPYEEMVVDIIPIYQMGLKDRG